MKNNNLIPRLIGLLLLSLNALLLCAIEIPQPALVKNIVVDYQADPTMPAAKIAAILQQAVDDVGAAGGGTVIIPADMRQWNIDRPIFVGWPNVTISGEGMGTAVGGAASAFILGIKKQYEQEITAEHYPKISQDAGFLDNSVTAAKYGLRTFDGKVSAAGYFPACPLAYGGTIKHNEGDIYWIDYERGVGKPVFWKNEAKYTINLAVNNNGTGVMKGVVCGVGPGGLTSAITSGTISDPLNIWTIESDKKSGANVAFNFKVLNNAGVESTKSLLLSKMPIGKGLLRISVQLDFTTGDCRAWFSLSTDQSQPLLISKLNLGPGYTFKAFEYGAFRLGAVTDNPFSGSPNDKTAVNGDWTYCGYSLFKDALYAIAGEDDQLGAIQKMAGDNTIANDQKRYFPAANHPTLVTWLPLDEQKAQIIAAYRDGYGSDGRSGYGYWLPMRPLQPIEGTITVQNIVLNGFWSCIGTGVALGEASHIVVRDVRMYGGYYHALGSWDCNPKNAKFEVHNSALAAGDALIYAKSADLLINDVDGGSPECDFRLVGCRGEITHVLITGFLAADYYFKLHAGPYGGPLTISYFCIDNEGLNYVPKKADFYAEPSLDPGPEGNLLIIRDVYTGTAPKGSAVLEVADPPGIVDKRVTGKFLLHYIDFGSSERNPAETIIRCKSNRWSGSLLNSDAAWTELPTLSYGLIKYEGVANAGKIISYSGDYRTLPTKGSWLTGSHVLRIANPLAGDVGEKDYIEYRCLQGGTYGTEQEPKWQAITK